MSLPRYALAGLAFTCLSEILMLLKIEPFWTWHTACAWTGYVLFADGLLWARRGDSWVRNAPRELAFMAIVSIPLWLIFEFYNLFIRNWHYVNLPENPFWRLLGFGWSFATIWPAILISAELIGTLRSDGIRESGLGIRKTQHTNPESRIPIPDRAMIVIGASLLVWPLIAPSPYLAAPVWLGFIFLLDPINARLGEASLLADLRRGSYARLVSLTLSGFLCGIVWEFWNYWARAKWIYTVPFMDEVRLFEMPLPGYLGFPAFAMECFTMYVFLRRFAWRGPRRILAL